MSKLTITDTSMASDATRHTATVVPGAVAEGGPTAWEVTWLPGRLLTRNQAITAMTIAEFVAVHNTVEGAFHAGQKLWLHLDNWASELGITGPRALALASRSPEDIRDGRAGLFLNGAGFSFAEGVLPPVPRPHGGFYRPRKLVAEQVSEDGDFTSVLVFGTHSPDVARPLADRLVIRECGSAYRALDPLPGWWRDRIVRGERTWLGDEKRGRAAVLFRQITETGGLIMIPFKPERAAVPMEGRKVHVYRLVVEYPPGSLEPGWEPSGWEPEEYVTYNPNGPDGDGFRWPVNRLCFSASTAKRRADLFRKYGATVTIERSDPVTWPEAARTVTLGQVSTVAVPAPACAHCGGEIVPCPNAASGTVPVCKGWLHAAYAGRHPVGAHYCEARSVNPSAEPSPADED